MKIAQEGRNVMELRKLVVEQDVKFGILEKKLALAEEEFKQLLSHQGLPTE